MGKTGQAQNQAPIFGGAGGQINTKLKDIKWTPKKLAMAFAILGIPFLIVVLLIFKSGNIMIGMVFIGLAAFIGLMYLALRFIDNNEF